MLPKIEKGLCEIFVVFFLMFLSVILNAYSFQLPVIWFYQLTVSY